MPHGDSDLGFMVAESLARLVTSPGPFTSMMTDKPEASLLPGQLGGLSDSVRRAEFGPLGA